MDLTNEDDPWVVGVAAEAQAGPETDPSPQIRSSVIKGFAPLDDQSDAKVPETLLPVLFAAEKGAPGAFVILDAALVRNLADSLATSGLAHKCLFRDDGDDDLRDVAPWLVTLDPAVDFTRHVFTQSDAPWDLWGRGAGILLRSPKPLDALCDHLRRFTKVATPSGTTLYLKFWHEAVLNAFLAQTPPDPIVTDLLDGVEIIYLATTPLAGPQLRHVRMETAA